MKLRGLKLNNVRQFTTPVRITGFGDGLNVLAAPNESGKSTIFEAIRAVIFVRHSAKGQWLESFRPNVGGNPEVTLDITHEDGLDYRLFKRWGSKARAEVYRGGKLIAQAGEAEAWITRLSVAGDGPGPAGLLWVRQGVTALDQGEKRELDDARTARRDLLSSVTGEFETLTGGRRMDALLRQTQTELDALVTKSGKARTGTPLGEAEARVADLQARETELAAKTRDLHDALTRRQELQRELARLEDPEDAKERNDRLSAARAALDLAQRHSEAVSALSDKRARAQQAREDIEKQRQHRAEVCAKLAQLETEAGTLRPECESAQARIDAAAQAHERSNAALNAARESVQSAEAALLQAIDASQTQERLSKRAQLQAAWGEAKTLSDGLPKLKKAAATGPDSKDLEALETAARDLATAQALASATAPRIAIRYDTDARAEIDGVPVDDHTPTPLPHDQRLSLPGIGSLQVVTDGSAKHAKDAVRAQRSLDQALARWSVDTLDQARQARRDRNEAAQRLKESERALSRLAPNGIDVLRAEIDALADLSAPQMLVDMPSAQAAFEAARQQVRACEVQETKARVQLETLQNQKHTHELKLVSVEQRLKDGTAHLAGLPTEEALQNAFSQAQTEEATLQAQLAEETEKAPDLNTCQSRLKRAQEVIDQAQNDILRLTGQIASLDGAIETRAGEGVEDALADTRLRLEGARHTQAALWHEVAVLTRLKEALNAAQSGARDRYFEPVLRELRPLLDPLWPGAQLVFDGDDLLPSALIRDGQTEALTSLSGGTREQIALMVRLAFAKLLTKNGRHTPVILDDALVYTDDTRIEVMFDALHGQADGLQILVLSCRNRALRALGGTNLQIEPDVENDPA